MEMGRVEFSFFENRCLSRAQDTQVSAAIRRQVAGSNVTVHTIRDDLFQISPVEQEQPVLQSAPHAVAQLSLRQGLAAIPRLDNRPRFKLPFFTLSSLTLLPTIS